MSVRPPPSISTVLAERSVGRGSAEIRSILFPRTRTFFGPLSWPLLPSKIRTLLMETTEVCWALTIEAAPAIARPRITPRMPCRVRVACLPFRPKTAVFMGLSPIENVLSRYRVPPRRRERNPRPGPRQVRVVDGERAPRDQQELTDALEGHPNPSKELSHPRATTLQAGRSGRSGGGHLHCSRVFARRACYLLNEFL